MNCLVSIARNEKLEPSLTAASISPFTDFSVFLDDGGENLFSNTSIVVKNKNSLGVGKSRREAVKIAFRNGAKRVILCDSHVRYISGDMDKAWKLAENYIVCPSSISMNSNHAIGCAARLRFPRCNANWTKAKEGEERVLMGGVYLMNVITALQILFPSTSHGYNEELMTLSAVALGHKIYCMPSLCFSHLYRKSAPYSISSSKQINNQKIIQHMFFGEETHPEYNNEQKWFYNKIQEKRKYNPEELKKYLDEKGMVKHG